MRDAMDSTLARKRHVQTEIPKEIEQRRDLVGRLMPCGRFLEPRCYTWENKLNRFADKVTVDNQMYFGRI